MAILLVRGVAKRLNAGFNGAIYGPIIWTAAPAGIVDLVPINGGKQVDVTARANAPAGGVVLTVSSLNSAKKVIGGSCTCAVEQVVTPPPVFHFETPTDHDTITDQDAVDIVFDKWPGGTGKVIANVRGNGKTAPTFVWPDANSSFFSPLPDTPGGGKVWQDVHASGNMLVLYNCAAGKPTIKATGATAPPPGGGTTDPTPPTAPPGPPPVPAPEFTLTVKFAADGSYTLDPPTPGYFVQALPDGNYISHFGTIWTGVPAGHLPPHHVDIIDADGMPVIHADLRAHYWNSRVPFRTKPITIQRTPADLVAEGFSFPYGDPGVPVQPCANYQYWGPFAAAFAGMTVYMPTTGERPDIGLLNDPEGHFMRTGQAGPMLAWAQTGTDWPWFFRDEKAGNFIDLTVYPQADSYDLPGYQADKPYIWKGPKDPKNGYPGYGGGMAPQLAHLTSVAYIAGAATKDLTFLATVQAEAQFACISSAEASKPDGVVIHGEWRGSAWGHGMLFKAIRLTEDFEARAPLPPGYRSSVYFKALNTSTLKFWNAQMTNDVAIASGVCMDGTADVVGPWQQNYWLTVLALGLLTGRQEWLAFYLRMLKFAVMIYGGADGFPPGYGTPYYIDLRDDHGVAIADGKTLFAEFLENELRNAQTAADHGQTYDPQVTQAQYDALLIDPLNGGKAMVGAGYNISGRAALVMADHLDRNGPAYVRGKVRAAHPSFDLALKNITTMVKAAGYMEPKVAVIAP